MVVASRETRVRKDLTVLDGEAWSWRRHADVCLLPGCGNFRSRKRFVAMTAAALDEGKSGNLQRQNALFHHIYAVLESASQDPSHETGWGWTQRAVSCPWASRAGQSAVVVHHKERVALDAVCKSVGVSASTASETSASVAQTSRKRSRRSSVAEMRKEAKGRVARKARKARGDQVRQGPARASSGASPARLLREPVSGRLGRVFLPFVSKNWGKGRLSHQRATSALAQC